MAEGKMCYLVEDSPRHLRCRGMTGDSCRRVKTNRIDEFSERGQTDKFPLKNGDLFT